MAHESAEQSFRASGLPCFLCAKIVLQVLEPPRTGLQAPQLPWRQKLCIVAQAGSTRLVDSLKVISPAGGVRPPARDSAERLRVKITGCIANHRLPPLQEELEKVEEILAVA